MTDKQVKDACAKYAAKLDSMGCRPQPDVEASTKEAKLDHVRWMCGEVPPMLPERREKAMRWLGFMQGVLSALEVLTIEEMKGDNR